MTGPHLVRIDGAPGPRVTAAAASAFHRTADGWIALAGTPPIDDATIATLPTRDVLRELADAVEVAEDTWRTFTCDPQLRALDAIAEVAGPDGSTTAFTHRWVHSATNDAVGRARSGAPGHGADTAAILADLGYDEAARDALAMDGVIVAAQR
jgi:crotonobetainyl-CoA:carnitine CoA-transferase CaiB-like acyl-CoA transferase